MKVGMDSFTVNHLQLNPYQVLDLAKKLGLDGVQYGGISELSKSHDVGELKDIRDYATTLGMYIEVSTSVCNPLLTGLKEADQQAQIENEIRLFAALGWHELRSVISRYDERYRHPIPWEIHLQKSSDFVRSLRPVLADCDSRINLENHGDSTFDILHVVETAGEDICGVCLDTANTLVNAEDPVLATKRVAPYTHMTHIKDGIIFFTANGVTRQSKPVGQGIVDFAQIIPILNQYNPGLTLSIEDHKGLFEFSMFDEQWIEKNPGLTPYELGQYVKLASVTEHKLKKQEIDDVDTYEAIPYPLQMEERVRESAQYLRMLLEMNEHSNGRNIAAPSLF